ncbi:MAG TPA: sigma-54-dependent Fis family transcriptional regulator, partial [Candidatus Cloacimonetes bacterium]|nr:sigma-54-dependent Fis family transcriptional regulator [Candidatus Cloacimonadota bacterium]
MGSNFLKYLLKTKELNSKVIIISGEASRTQVSVAMKLGAYTFVEKTGHFNTKKFLADVRQAINLKQQEEQNKRLKDDNINLRKELEPRKVFIGECPEILKVKEQIKRYAKKDISVLIYGETGTGKEVVANNLYWESERNGKPFEIVHIGGLNENLIDSELFGHKKGAFTGADYDKIGKFEKADQGIVFLDEISDFDLNIQAKLKRAIENKEIQMIGGNTKKIDVKFIFATNQNLLEKIRNNEFREDLYERMDVAKIELPPLRERGNDIILLMKHFFSILSQKHDRYDNSDLKSLK